MKTFFNPSNLLFYLLYLFYLGTRLPYWLIKTTVRPNEIIFIKFSPLFWMQYLFIHHICIILSNNNTNRVTIKSLCSSVVHISKWLYKTPLCKQLPFLLKMWKKKKSNAFFKIVPYYCDEEINSGKHNVLMRIQYYDTLDTLPKHSWRMSLWSEWELDLQRLITVVKCMHFFILRKNIAASL